MSLARAEGLLLQLDMKSATCVQADPEVGAKVEAVGPREDVELKKKMKR